ncbi:MAG: hypothetical protein ACOYNC_10745 [Bacteroidales bacterium]
MNSNMISRPQTGLLAVLFLLINVMGFGSIAAEKKDTLNPRVMLKQLDSIREQLQTAAMACDPKKTSLIFPNIIEVKSSKRAGNLIVFGDYISVKVDSIPALVALTDSVTGKVKDTMSEVVLYINGNAMRDIGVMNIDWKEKSFTFQLDRHSEYLMKFYPKFSYLWSSIPVEITAGYRSGLMIPIAPSLKPSRLKYVSNWSISFSLLFIVTMFISFVILAVKTNLIRIGDDHSPFSLALTQLSFWSIVVASSFIYIWVVSEELPPITGSTLVLISVSALTTAGSRLVDIRRKTKSDLVARSTSFLEDILQDELGYSVHRAQMFMWTVIMGIVFVTSVIRFQQIPQLDESLLALMGISSGAYVGLKTMENKPDDDPTVEEKTTEKPEGV